MILLLSVKQWKDTGKKLVMPRDYIIFDATEDDDSRMNRLTNCVSMDAMNPPTKLVKMMQDDDADYLNYNKIEKAEKNFFKGPGFQQGMMAAVTGELHENANIFIVFRNKAFKTYGKRIKKEFEKAFPVEFDFVEVFSGDFKDHKKALQEGHSKSNVTELERALKKKEKEMERVLSKKKK